MDGYHNKEEGIHQFLLPKTNMVHDLADNLAKVVKLIPGGTGKIRIFEISKDGKTQKEFTGSEMIGNIPEPVELYAEEVPREELEADDSDKVIGVFHFSKELSRTHGVPFKFVVKRGEKICRYKETSASTVRCIGQRGCEVSFCSYSSFNFQTAIIY